MSDIIILHWSSMQSAGQRISMLTCGIFGESTTGGVASYTYIWFSTIYCFMAFRHTFNHVNSCASCGEKWISFAVLMRAQSAGQGIYCLYVEYLDWDIVVSHRQYKTQTRGSMIHMDLEVVPPFT